MATLTAHVQDLQEGNDKLQQKLIVALERLTPSKRYLRKSDVGTTADHVETIQTTKERTAFSKRKGIKIVQRKRTMYEKQHSIIVSNGMSAVEN